MEVEEADELRGEGNALFGAGNYGAACEKYEVRVLLSALLPRVLGVALTLALPLAWVSSCAGLAGCH
jgi:hypothetical protein